MQKIKTVCVFGSSSESIEKDYLDSAEHLGKILAERGISVVFGGGRYGVMGAVARGVSSAAGKLIGVSPKFFIKMGVLFDEVQDMIYTDTMRERKAVMEDSSSAFIICAGGIGTFEEFFEVLTLKQLGRHKKPIIIYNYKGYYDELIAMMNASVEKKFMSDKVNKLYTVADMCEMCAHFVSDDELGDYCSVSLDEDEMARFLTQSVKGCSYFQLYDEYKIVQKQN